MSCLASILNKDELFEEVEGGEDVKATMRNSSSSGSGKQLFNFAEKAVRHPGIQRGAASPKPGPLKCVSGLHLSLESAKM